METLFSEEIVADGEEERGRQAYKSVHPKGAPPKRTRWGDMNAHTWSPQWLVMWNVPDVREEPNAQILAKFKK